MIKKVSSTNPDFYYFLKGSHPKLLIHSGTHGDEYEVIDLVEKYIRRYEAKLPDFIFVPKVSPSAVAAKTRKNSQNADINRTFSTNSIDPEVRENIKILKD